MLNTLGTSIVLLLCCLTLSFAQAQEYVTILHLNDTHSNLAPSAPRDAAGAATVGGIARAAMIIGAEKAAEPNALILHAGDAFIGDPVYNLSMATMLQPELQMLTQIGVDAMAAGNHEFDLGPDALLGCLATSFAASGFPLLSANLDYSGAPQHGLQNFVFPNIVKQSGNVKVGIFGMTATEVEDIGTAEPIVVSTNLVAIAAEQVAELQTQGCDLIIFLSHLGYQDDLEVAAEVPGIHLIVGGHDHLQLSEATEVSNSGGTTYIVQSGSFYRQMGKTRLKIDNGEVTLDGYSLIQLDASVEEAPPLKSAVDDIYQQLDAATGGILLAQVGHATGFLTEEATNLLEEGIHDTHIGNLCADAFVAATGADFSFQPGGSTAQPIYTGPILALDLFRTIGYGMNETNGLGFPLMTVDMTGMALWGGLEFSLAQIDINDEMFPQVSSELSYRYDPTKPPLSRMWSLTVDGAPIDMGKTYTVAVNYLVLMYLDMIGQLNPAIAYSNPKTYPSAAGPDPLTEFEALMGYVAAMQPLSPDPLPGRVTAQILVSVETGQTVPLEMKLEQNHPNPFSSSTVLTFSLHETMHASIAVYDVIGRRVAEIADRDFAGGTHHLNFSTNTLPSGMYFCRMSADGVQRTIRMVLSR